MKKQELLEKGLWFHGHKCPAMPMGLRVSLAAMQALDVVRAGAGELVALVELDEAHCATCFADGVQVATGCTFGKGNIKKLHYGKWGLTLIDKKQGKAVRVAPLAAAMEANKRTEFMTQRKAGVPPTVIPEAISQPLVDRVMNAPDDQLFRISEVFDYQVEELPHTFESVVCEACGEMVVERNARVQGGRVLCIPCAGLG
ncbi:MAG: TraR/DksA C4-type zinc finger protein [Anaerolineae bacterium]|nr:TraR/DksA C4-type zinc finger protein [Anaerolineae bacterium]